MTSGRLRRNIAINIVGQGVPLAVAVVCIPFVIRIMGPERFGVLALAWTFIGYFAVFDMGLGRSLTQRVAELVGQGRDDDVPSIAWTGTTATFVLGLVGSACVVLAAGPLVRSVLRIPPELAEESLRALRVLGLSLPIVLSTNALRGILEAYQRFGLVTLVRAPTGAFMFLGPLLVLPFTPRLDVVVAVIVAFRVAAWIANAGLCVWVNRELLHPRWPRWHRAEVLFRMGGWLTVSNIVSPVLVYADRFLIGSLISMSALAYYTTPSEVVTRASAVPVAIAGVFFPAFAATFRTDPNRTGRLFSSSVRAVFLLTFPLLLPVFVFAEVGLTAWVGADFALNGTAVTRWLVIGVLFNGLAQIPLALVHGAARADVTARQHLWEMPFYLVLLWYLLGVYGLAGAAIAWSARGVVDAGLLFFAASRIVPETRRAVQDAGWWSIVVSGLIAAAWWLLLQGWVLAAFLLPLTAFSIAGWRTLMRPEWKATLLARGRSLTGAR